MDTLLYVGGMPGRSYQLKKHVWIKIVKNLAINPLTSIDPS
ncbi:hypothetical protein E2C01_049570 [Portunus trituberculatus]|uniref:Uncharacterized protein n=1 Tax=Portunus trituberculatus TaxID=210409 RepID=A0A5B7GE83_PORTR|nr:hypothetical protein [Portunus trituberculatus]